MASTFWFVLAQPLGEFCLQFGYESNECCGFATIVARLVAKGFWCETFISEYNSHLPDPRIPWICAR